MAEFRVTYVAVKHDKNEPVWSEEAAVNVQAANDAEAISKATSHLPSGLSVSAHAAHVRG